MLKSRWARSAAVPPILLGLFAAALVLLTIPDFGITWDEGTYSTAGNHHAAWFRNPRFSTIDTFWRATHEHPPLGFMGAGFFRYLFTFRLHWVSSAFSCRLQAPIFAFIAVFALFSLVRTEYDRWTSALAAVSFLLLPRAFADAHYVALDYPSTALWAAAAWAFWKGLSRTRWLAAAGLAAGLTMLTKVNGFFLYALLLAWYVGWNARSFGPKRESAPGRQGVLLGLLALTAIPPLTFFAGWPWLWPAPFERFQNYLIGQLAHVTIPTFYAGTTSVAPPWHYPFVLTAVTVPLVTLLPLLVGPCALAHPSRRSFILFILTNALVPIAVVAFFTRCKYDGIRLFLQSFPFLCALAAVGVHEMFELAQRRRAGKAFAATYAALFALSVCLSTVRYHPYQSAYYNEIVGGASGAAANFESEYWGGAFHGAMDWIHANAERKFWVPIGRDALEGERKLGRLDADIQLSEKRGPDSDYLVLMVRQGTFDEELWRYFRTEKPVFSVAIRGAPLVNIYRLR